MRRADTEIVESGAAGNGLRPKCVFEYDIMTSKVDV